VAVSDIEVEQGKTFSLSLRWSVSGDGGLTKSAVSLVGRVARMQIRARVGAPAWVTATSDTLSPDYSAASHITLEANGDTGRVDIYLSATATALIQEHGVYEVKIITDADQKNTLVRGKVHLVKEVTSG
jgi:hypothetical protein